VINESMPIIQLSITQTYVERYAISALHAARYTKRGI